MNFSYLVLHNLYNILLLFTQPVINYVYVPEAPENIGYYIGSAFSDLSQPVTFEGFFCVTGVHGK